ncbi:SIR2 family protein [Tsuneonella rigui]|uniref:SIR2 family protein n=1 Tax=Tsuneonella rigui TaxID=1708790 RepID=UPI000F7F6563|nr:SIR2 family protein [Tsuneonella rigui]
MAGKPLALLGAGASIDAGLLNTFDLTQEVYNYLVARGYPEGHLFGYVISKLLVRATRNGGSPFQRVDVETAYDAVKQFLRRDSNVLSEFVTGWDDLRAFGDRPEPFDEGEFRSSFYDILERRPSRSLTSTNAIAYSINRHAIENISHTLGRSLRGTGSPAYDADRFIEVLVRLLTPREESYSYVERLLEHASDRFSCIGSLNYDLLLERSAKSRGISIDYGLRSWNLRRYIKFYDGEIKLIKLHGSLNWYLENFDDIEVSDRLLPNKKHALIFGGQAEKLFSDGPFLALRHSFFEQLRQSNILLVAGYSFGDQHVNAMIRAWMRTRRQAKLIVINPGLDKRALDVFAHRQRVSSGEAAKAHVEIRLIEEPFAEGLNEALHECMISADPTRSPLTSEVLERLSSRDAP